MSHAAVLEIVREYTKASISPDARFDDLGIDSLEFIQIVADVENVIGVRIPNDALPRIHTVRDLIAEAVRHSS